MASNLVRMGTETGSIGIEKKPLKNLNLMLNNLIKIIISNTFVNIISF